MLQNKFSLAVCDDIIEYELDSTSKAGQVPQNNDFLLSEVKAENLDENLNDERRAVLYKFKDSSKVDGDVLDNVLGKKRQVKPESELERAVALEYVRDYVVVEKDSQFLSKGQIFPHQASDFLLVAEQQHFSENH